MNIAIVICICVVVFVIYIILLACLKCGAREDDMMYSRWKAERLRNLGHLDQIFERANTFLDCKISDWVQVSESSVLFKQAQIQFKEVMDIHYHYAIQDVIILEYILEHEYDYLQRIKKAVEMVQSSGNLEEASRYLSDFLPTK